MLQVMLTELAKIQFLTVQFQLSLEVKMLTRFDEYRHKDKTISEDKKDIVMGLSYYIFYYK
jgi:hypothetical protein